MATSMNISKYRKDDVQLESTSPGEMELPDTHGNMDPNANWGAEPNFNLNFNSSSPSNPRSIAEVSKPPSTNQKEDRNKVGVNRPVTTDTTRSLMSPGEKLKNTLQVCSSSPTTRTTMIRRTEHQLEPPATLGPKMQTLVGVPSIPKPNAVKLVSRPRSTERVKTDTPKGGPPKPRAAPTGKLTTKSANKTTNVSLKIQSSKTESGKKVDPGSTRIQSSPHLANRTPTVVIRAGTDPARTSASKQRPEHNPRTPGSETSSRGPRSLSVPIRASSHPRTTTSQVTSRSPKPPMTRKTTRTRNSNTSGSKEYLHGKNSSAGSGSKTNTKSSLSSKVTTVSKDSLNSKGSLDSKSQTGSKDTLDSKSISASKSSLDSKDSLDSKTDWTSRSGSKPRSKMGSRDSLDSKTTQEIKATKLHQDSGTIIRSKTKTGSENKQTPEGSETTKVITNPKTSPCFNASSELNISSGSDGISNSKSDVTQSTSNPTLQVPGSSIDLPGPVSLSPMMRGRPKTTGSGAKPSSDPKSPSDFSRSGPVRMGLKSTLHSSLISANQSPGSSPGERLSSTSAGPNGQNQSSPSSSPGFLTPLASSSPKTKTIGTPKTTRESTEDPTSSAVMKRSPGSSVLKTGLTRGLTFDSITKTTAKTRNDSEKEHFKLTESKTEAAGEPEGSTETDTDNNGCLPQDNGRNSGPHQGKLDQLGNTNVILSSRAMSGKQEKKKQMGRSEGLEKTSSGPCARLSPSCPTSASKLVKESWTMTEVCERLHPQPGEQKDVGLQVDVEVVKYSISTSPTIHQEAPICSLIGSPCCQSSVSCVPPLKHSRKIQLNNHMLLSSSRPPKTSSLPTCVPTFSFQQSPALMSEVGPKDQVDISAENICEDEMKVHTNMEDDGWSVKRVKPQQVAWDDQGMTWEVYGASVDLESLGKAIQSHLESKIREQQKHIWSLRKSICSNSNFREYKVKKRRRKFPCCCVKTSPVVD